uniref:Uncharacterized protein n=1 Tax=Nelumbo nucifera TaxID=4432 RepID=A0A822Y1I8_NELNU|nr:TPA_asm: hypothetical protein HUJ06_027795 [Nelumbo nucifera]
MAAALGDQVSQRLVVSSPTKKEIFWHLYSGFIWRGKSAKAEVWEALQGLRWAKLFNLSNVVEGDSRVVTGWLRGKQGWAMEIQTYYKRIAETNSRVGSNYKFEQMV